MINLLKLILAFLSKRKFHASAALILIGCGASIIPGNIILSIIAVFYPELKIEEQSIFLGVFIITLGFILFFSFEYHLFQNEKRKTDLAMWNKINNVLSVDTVEEIRNHYSANKSFFHQYIDMLEDFSNIISRSDTFFRIKSLNSKLAELKDSYSDFNRTAPIRLHPAGNHLYSIPREHLYNELPEVAEFDGIVDNVLENHLSLRVEIRKKLKI